MTVPFLRWVNLGSTEPLTPLAMPVMRPWRSFIWPWPTLSLVLVVPFPDHARDLSPIVRDVLFPFHFLAKSSFYALIPCYKYICVWNCMFKHFYVYTYMYILIISNLYLYKYMFVCMYVVNACTLIYMYLLGIRLSSLIVKCCFLLWRLP